MAAFDALKSCSLLKGFTDTGLQILAGIAAERTFPRGAPLFVENMVAESLFIIGQGKVSISVKGNNGEEIPVGELGPGDSLGELALLQQGQRMCSAVALTMVSALELRSSDFQRLLGQKPQACLKLLMAVVAQFSARLADNREALRTLIPRGSHPRV
jgi:CRP/FNR family transcriptional regulator, cyclic AMP receptor protein